MADFELYSEEVTEPNYNRSLSSIVEFIFGTPEDGIPKAVSATDSVTSYALNITQNVVKLIGTDASVENYQNNIMSEKLIPNYALEISRGGPIHLDFENSPSNQARCLLLTESLNTFCTA